MQSPPNFTERLLLAMEESETQTFSKGEMILTEGHVEKQLYFIETGAVRVFLLTEFEEQTIRFGYKGSLINSLSSFITGKPSEFYIEAMRKVTIRSVKIGC